MFAAAHWVFQILFFWKQPPAVAKNDAVRAVIMLAGRLNSELELEMKLHNAVRIQVAILCSSLWATPFPLSFYTLLIEKILITHPCWNISTPVLKCKKMEMPTSATDHWVNSCWGSSRMNFPLQCTESVARYSDFTEISLETLRDLTVWTALLMERSRAFCWWLKPHQLRCRSYFLWTDDTSVMNGNNFLLDMFV